jgi:GrpB-like predicted nucleotidyltransferase (UPF0157 family)
VSQRPDDELERYLETVTLGELECRAVEIVAYDPAWADRYAEEAAAIHAALDGRERLLEHIGSTAVPGLAAKPVVDILLVIDDPADEAAYVPALEAAGYELRIREPAWFDHRMLRTPARDVHLHVLPAGCPEIERYLLLRDRLRSDASERELYAVTKRRLATQEWPTVQHYAEAKSEVVEAIIARARAAQDGVTRARAAAGDDPSAGARA